MICISTSWQLGLGGRLLETSTGFTLATAAHKSRCDTQFSD